MFAFGAKPAEPTNVMLVPANVPGCVKAPPRAFKVNDAVPVSIAVAGKVKVVPAIALTALFATLVKEAIVSALTSTMLTAPPLSVTAAWKSFAASVSVISPVPALIALVPVTFNAPSCVIGPLLLVATRLPPTVP